MVSGCCHRYLGRLELVPMFETFQILHRHWKNWDLFIGSVKHSLDYVVLQFGMLNTWPRASRYLLKLLFSSVFFELSSYEFVNMSCTLPGKWSLWQHVHALWLSIKSAPTKYKIQSYRAGMTKADVLVVLKNKHTWDLPAACCRTRGRWAGWCSWVRSGFVVEVAFLSHNHCDTSSNGAFVNPVNEA